MVWLEKLAQARYPKVSSSILCLKYANLPTLYNRVYKTIHFKQQLLFAGEKSIKISLY